MDVFTVQAVDMINLTKVTIGHDGQGQGNGWFLDKIVVKESPEADQQFIFNCARFVPHRFKKLVSFVPSQRNIVFKKMLTLSKC